MDIKLPSITLAQVVAAIIWFVTQIIAWGWIDNDTGQWIISLVGTLLPGFWMVADSIIRHGRATGVGASLVGQGTSVKNTTIS